MILPGVRHAPGFVSGIWTRTSDGTGSTVVVAFTSGEAATDFLRSVNGNAEGQAAVGMTLDEATVVSVMAEA
ncbi:MAG TPA: hypothetical protein VM030_06035 [Acidimicrobiales bacterium]|nr:hypothetical protein [Acidimicrobiales bacterium]